MLTQLSSRKRVALLLAMLSILALSWSLESHSWFVTKANPETSMELKLSSGALSTIEVVANSYEEHVTRTVTNHARAQRLARSNGFDSTDEDAADAAVFWKAGITLVVVGCLACLALLFAIISCVKGTRWAQTVSPKGLVAGTLFLLLLVSLVFVTHAPAGEVDYGGRLVPGLSLWIFYAATLLGYVANELMTKHYVEPHAMPTATVVR